MARTITNFLVGIGLDTRNFEKGERRVHGGLKSIRSGVLITGAALAAGLALAAKAAVNAGNRIDGVALSAAKLNTSAKFVYNYGNALRILGGNAEDSLQALDSVEQALADFRIKGEFGAFADPTLAGVDTSALTQAANGEEFLRMLSDMLPGLNKDQQRLIQQNFGFSDATMASLRRGSQYFGDIVSEAERLAPDFDASVESARKFNEELVKINLRFEGIANTLSAKLLGPMADILEKVNRFADDPAKPIRDTFRPLGKYVPNTPSGLILAPGGALPLPGSPEAAIGHGFTGLRNSAAMREASRQGAGMLRTTPLGPGTFMDRVKRSVQNETGALAGVPSASGGRTINNQINLKVELDGQALERKIIDVQTRRDQDTIDDITSTVAR